VIVGKTEAGVLGQIVGGFFHDNQSRNTNRRIPDGALPAIEVWRFDKSTTGEKLRTPITMSQAGAVFHLPALNTDCRP
jgi:hypothetical protein